MPGCRCVDLSEHTVLLTGRYRQAEEQGWWWRYRVNECISLLAVLLSCSRVSEQLYIWRTRQPSQTMHMRTATVLPLVPQPVVLCTKDVQVKGLEELLESLLEKPVSYSWVVNDCTSAGTCILWTILADQVCKLWPLKVSSTVSEEDSRKSKCVDHGYQAATLFHPVGTCSPERTSVVTDTAGKGSNYHVTQLIHRKACILRVLTAKYLKRGCLANLPSLYIIRFFK